MSCIAIIPARGGSRRIPRKNIRHFYRKPIISYSIETAINSGIFDRVAVSTEDQEIGKIVAEYGADVIIRPDHLSVDEVGTQEVMRYALEQQLTGYEYACCIYATTPMLQPNILVNAYSLLQSSQSGYVVPVATWMRDPGQFYFGRTQDFISKTPLHTKGTQIIWIDPKTECDINTESDWQRAMHMYAELHGPENDTSVANESAMHELNKRGNL